MELAKTLGMFYEKKAACYGVKYLKVPTKATAI
jgi:hypothetical protein